MENKEGAVITPRSQIGLMRTPKNNSQSFFVNDAKLTPLNKIAQIEMMVTSPKNGSFFGQRSKNELNKVRNSLMLDRRSNFMLQN